MSIQCKGIFLIIGLVNSQDLWCDKYLSEIIEKYPRPFPVNNMYTEVYMGVLEKYYDKVCYSPDDGMERIQNASFLLQLCLGVVQSSFANKEKLCRMMGTNLHKCFHAEKFLHFLQSFHLGRFRFVLSEPGDEGWSDEFYIQRYEEVMKRINVNHGKVLLHKEAQKQ